MGPVPGRWGRWLITCLRSVTCLESESQEEESVWYSHTEGGPLVEDTGLSTRFSSFLILLDVIRKKRMARKERKRRALEKRVREKMRRATLRKCLGCGPRKIKHKGKRVSQLSLNSHRNQN